MGGARAARRRAAVTTTRFGTCAPRSRRGSAPPRVRSRVPRWRASGRRRAERRRRRLAAPSAPRRERRSPRRVRSRSLDRPRAGQSPIRIRSTSAAGRRSSAAGRVRWRGVRSQRAATMSTAWRPSRSPAATVFVGPASSRSAGPPGGAVVHADTGDRQLRPTRVWTVRPKPEHIRSVATSGADDAHRP
jgi:hypothetical protein